MSAFRFLISGYIKLMNKHPFPMQVLQSGLLMGSGDIIAQSWLEKRNLDEIDWRRTCNYCAVGFCVVGPFVSRWYNFLEYLFGKNGIKTTLKKIVVDQSVFAPSFIAVLMSAISFTEGKSLQEIKFKLQSDYPDVLLTNYKIWPCVQVINFYFVPLNYRVVFVQFIALGWNTYLSWKISDTKKQFGVGTNDEYQLKKLITDESDNKLTPEELKSL